MADENKGGEGEAPKVHVDAFGDTRGEDGKIVPPVAPPAPAPEVGADGKPVVKVEEKKPEAGDLEKNPLVVELRTSIQSLTEKLTKETGDKSAMGKNLSAMRERLDKLEKGDTKGAAEPVFKKEEMKRVKDYTKEEQDAMTPAEKALIESNADMKERINGMVATAAKEAADKAHADGQKTEEEKEIEDTNARISTTVQPIALKLAGNDKDLANQIILNFNMFSGNDTLDDKQLAERVAMAARMIPDFKPAKEQASPAGGAVKAGGKDGEDPHGVQAIVDQARESRGGKTFSL